MRKLKKKKKKKNIKKINKICSSKRKSQSAVGEIKKNKKQKRKVKFSYSQLTPTTCRTCAIGKSVLFNKSGTGNKCMGSTSQKQYLIVSSAESQNARLAATSAEPGEA